MNSNLIWFANVLNIENKDLCLDKKLQDILEWDSFNIANFMINCEIEFGAKVTLRELSSFVTVQDVIEFLDNIQN